MYLQTRNALEPPPPVDCLDNGKIIAGTIIPLLFATIFVVGRCYSRLAILRFWGWEDSMIIVAWVTSTFVQVGGSVASPLSSTHVSAAHILGYTIPVAYQIALFSTKLSIAICYLRIIPRGKYHGLTWATIAALVCALTPLLITSILACNIQTGHLYFNYNFKCVPYPPVMYLSSGLQIFFDAWLIMLIIPFIVDLKIPPRQKAALMVILSGGVLVIAANIARLIIINNVRPFNLFAFGLWSSLEINIGIICASAPTILPLLRKIAPRTMALLTDRKTDMQLGTGLSMQLSRMRAREAALKLGSREGLASTAQSSKASRSVRKDWISEGSGSESRDEEPNGGKSNVHVNTNVVMAEERT